MIQTIRFSEMVEWIFVAFSIGAILGMTLGTWLLWKWANRKEAK